MNRLDENTCSDPVAVHIRVRVDNKARTRNTQFKLIKRIKLIKLIQLMQLIQLSHSSTNLPNYIPIINSIK